MKNQKINKSLTKEKKQKSFEAARIQAFRQFMAAHLREISFKDSLYEMRTSHVIN